MFKMEDDDEDDLKPFGFPSVKIKRFDWKLSSWKDSASDVEPSSMAKSVPEYTLGPFYIDTINHNKDKIKQLYKKRKKLEEQLIECNYLSTNKSGKVKSGKDLALKFNS